MLTLTGTGSGSAAPPAPTGLVFSNVTTTSITISWDAVAGADHYTVQQRLTNADFGSGMNGMMDGYMDGGMDGGV